eukprot:IDg3316t1
MRKSLPVRAVRRAPQTRLHSRARLQAWLALRAISADFSRGSCRIVMGQLEPQGSQAEVLILLHRVFQHVE